MKNSNYIIILILSSFILSCSKTLNYDRIIINPQVYLDPPNLYEIRIDSLKVYTLWDDRKEYIKTTNIKEMNFKNIFNLNIDEIKSKYNPCGDDDGEDLSIEFWKDGIKMKEIRLYESYEKNSEFIINRINKTLTKKQKLIMTLKDIKKILKIVKKTKIKNLIKTSPNKGNRCTML